MISIGAVTILFAVVLGIISIFRETTSHILWKIMPIIAGHFVISTLALVAVTTSAWIRGDILYANELIDQWRQWITLSGTIILVPYIMIWAALIMAATIEGLGVFILLIMGFKEVAEFYKSGEKKKKAPPIELQNQNLDLDHEEHEAINEIYKEIMKVMFE